MPSIRVISAEPEYNRLGREGRRIIALGLQAAAGTVLDQEFSGIEAYWLAPIDSASAVNVLRYSVDVEFSTIVTDSELEELANTLLAVFDNDLHINPGEGYGVWIKTPYKYLWKERTKKPSQGALHKLSDN